jgi:hypothetical protein
VSRPFQDLVHVEDPAFYLNPWPISERLRSEALAYFYAPFNTWILTKHEDVLFAARTPEIFSVEHGFICTTGSGRTPQPLGLVVR